MAELNEHYDVVIVGGAMMGSSTAWWLSRESGFDGSVLVVERDPSYEHSSTSATNSCVRQQFSNEVNIRISQFTAEFIRTFPSWFDGADVPELATNYFGYLYLAADPTFANVLKANQQLQASWGAATRILDRDELAAAFPFYNLDDIVCGSHNPVDEGYFDGGTMFDTFRTHAQRNGFRFAQQWGPEHEADLAVNYIKNTGGQYRKPEQPFALVVSMNPPHTPYDQFPPRYLKAYALLMDSEVQRHIVTAISWFITKPPCPFKVFTDQDEAEAWLLSHV